MPEVKAPNCPNCHAPLPMRPGVAMLRCEYCGREVMLKHTQMHGAQIAPPIGPHGRPGIPGSTGHHVANQPHVFGTPPQHAHFTTADYKKHYTKYIVLSVGISLLAIAVPMIVSFSAQRQTARAIEQATRGVTAPPQRPTGHWVATGSGVLAADIDGDGVEDFVVRRHEDHDDSLYVVAMSGAGFKPLWRSGPFGKGNDASTYSRVAMTDGHVVLVDEASTAHILDRASGVARHAAKVTDRADRVCGDPAGASVWIEVTDKKNVSLDLATGVATAAIKAPAWCPDVVSLSDQSDCWHQEYHRQRRARATCSNMPRKWKVEGFGRAYRLALPGEPKSAGYVAIGSKDPGTATPRLVGFTADGKVRWERTVSDDKIKDGTPEITDVAGETLIVAYEVDTWRWRVAGIDVNTGATRWDRALVDERISTMHLTVTSTRWYVVTRDILFVYDIDSGQERAQIRS